MNSIYLFIFLITDRIFLKVFILTKALPIVSGLCDGAKIEKPEGCRSTG